MKTLSILVIDDDPLQLQYITELTNALDTLACEVHCANSAKEGFSILEEKNIDCIITDYVMPEIDGLGVLKHVKSYKPTCDVVVVTAKADIESAVNLMRLGAYDYLIKPIRKEQLYPILESIGEKKSIFRENLLVRERLQSHPNFNYIVSKSRTMEEVLSIASRAAASNATILIRGESGTGKELIAQAIHATGNRKDKPFVAVNIAALSETLIESELFGHKKGSFTGAIADRIGRFEEADQGTLFIDEAGDIPPKIQIKLLRAIQFGKIERVGESHSIPIDVRIIAATNQDLESLIEGGAFRKDLFYRLNVITLWLPPLYQRKEDIPPLVNHFISVCKEKNKKEILGISEEAMDKLIKYPFHGNVRELENMIERAVVLCRGDYITSRDIFSQQEAFSSLRSSGYDGQTGHGFSGAGQAGEGLTRARQTGGGLPEAGRPDGQAVVGQLGGRALQETRSGGEPLQEAHSPGGEDYEKKMHHFETNLILSALKNSGGNKSAAARSMGITERRLRSRIEILGLEKET